MRQTLAIAGVMAVLFVVGARLMTSESAAEPISGTDRAAPPDRPAQASEMTDAVALFKAHDVDGALKQLREAVKKNAELPPAQLLLAQLFAQANMPAEMWNALEQAAVEAPGDPETYVLMADLVLHDRHATAAQLLYQEANRRMPGFDSNAKRKAALELRIRSGLAGVAEVRKDWAGAQKQLEAWLKLDADNAGALQRLAYCLLQQKNVEGALEKLRQAAKIGNAPLAPEAVLAQLFEASGDRANAKKWMATALAAAPDDLRLRLVAGEWALTTGQPDEAQKQAIAAMRIDPKSPKAKILRAVVALVQKEHAAAEMYADLALTQSPDNLAASDDLALALIEQNDEAKSRRALELAEANAKRYPQMAETAATYGWVLYKLGRLDEAERALRTATSLEGFGADGAYYFARLSADRGRKAEARRLLEIALKRNELFIYRAEAEELLTQLKKQ